MELLTSYSKWRDNAAHMKRMRIRPLNRLTMQISLLLVFISMQLPIYYTIGTLMLSVGPSIIEEEVYHTYKVITEEARKQPMSVS